MRHFATAATVAGLLAWAAPAAAQTIIGDTGAPSVEVNLGVLQGLSSDPASTAQPASSGSGSVLLIAPQSGGGSAAAAGTSGGSVLLLGQPATTPAQSGSVFVFPELPATKPAVPETTVLSSTAATAVAAPEPEPEAELEPVAIVPEPEPSGLAVAESDIQAQPEATAAATAAQTDVVAAAAGDDPFAQLDDMLNQPLAPEEIEVPAPEMEIDTDEVVVMPSTGGASMTPDGLDLRILFEPGSDAMTDQDRAMLKQLADRLASDQNQRIQLRAYASSDDGTDSAARRLALSRALQVRAYLIENNVRSTRIDVRALGDKVEGEGPLDRIDIVLVES